MVREEVEQLQLETWQPEEQESQADEVSVLLHS